jgi:hypothetical protein
LDDTAYIVHMPFPNYRVQLITPSFKSNVPQNESGHVLHSGDLYNLPMNESLTIIKKPQILIIGLRKIINFTPEHL